MSALLANISLSWRHKTDSDTVFFVLRIADIHPLLLRVPEVHTEDSSVRSGMGVKVGGAKRYMVSDNAKKISWSHYEK
jgi:hypothetical protein